MVLNPKHTHFNVFIPKGIMFNNFLNFLWDVLYTKTIEINHFIRFHKQYNPMCACVFTFTKIYDICSFFIVFGKFLLEKTPLNLGSFLK